MAGRRSTRPFCLLSFPPLKETNAQPDIHLVKDRGYKDFRQKGCILHSIGFQRIEMDKKISWEWKINLSQTKNHSPEIDFSSGAEKKTLLWCKIKRTPPSYSPLHSLPFTKGSLPNHLSLTFFKAKTYCNSLSGESVCRISAGESCTLRSGSKVADDKKLIICIQEKNFRIKP